MGYSDLMETQLIRTPHTCFPTTLHCAFIKLEKPSLSLSWGVSLQDDGRPAVLHDLMSFIINPQWTLVVMD